MKRKKLSRNERIGHKRAILFLILLAIFFGGITQILRYQVVVADTVRTGISFTSTIPSNTDASREGRSYEENVSYTGATGLQARFTIINEGGSDFTDVAFTITAPSLVTLDDSISFSDPDLSDTEVLFTERGLGDTL